MWLSSTAQIALRAVLHIAEHGGEGPVRVEQIATAIGTPRNYLSKTLHSLARAGVLRSTRGPKGGFQLVDLPEEVPLSRVVGPFEPTGEQRCLVGRPNCGMGPPCLAHHHWSSVATAVQEFFGNTTVADLLKPATQTHAA